LITFHARIACRRTNRPHGTVLAKPQIHPTRGERVLRPIHLVSLLLTLSLFVGLLSGCATDSVAGIVGDVAEPASAADIAEIQAAATQLLAGSEGSAGQPLSDRGYAGPLEHAGGSACNSCHGSDLEAEHGPESPHWGPSVERCAPCHKGVASPAAIRGAQRPDHDGDGDLTEPLSAELESLLADLLAAIRDNAEAASQPICYHPQRYPHWMQDPDNDGLCDDTEARASNAYQVWSAPLLRASCNYQVVARDPGAWAHNFDYSAQLVIDSIEALGRDTDRYARPD
jgi:hypothetical protein